MHDQTLAEQATKPQETPQEPKEPQDLLLSALDTALAALNLLDEYRALPRHEQERVHHFVREAKKRQGDPEAERVFVALDWFKDFIHARLAGDAEAVIRADQELTAVQYAGFTRAWESVQAIAGEVDAAVLGGHAQMDEIDKEGGD